MPRGPMFPLFFSLLAMAMSGCSAATEGNGSTPSSVSPVDPADAENFTRLLVAPSGLSAPFGAAFDVEVRLLQSNATCLFRRDYWTDNPSHETVRVQLTNTSRGDGLGLTIYNDYAYAAYGDFNSASVTQRIYGASQAVADTGVNFAFTNVVDKLNGTIRVRFAATGIEPAALQGPPDAPILLLLDCDSPFVVVHAAGSYEVASFTHATLEGGIMIGTWGEGTFRREGGRFTAVGDKLMVLAAFDGVEANAELIVNGLGREISATQDQRDEDSFLIIEHNVTALRFDLNSLQATGKYFGLVGTASDLGRPPEGFLAFSSHTGCPCEP